MGSIENEIEAGLPSDKKNERKGKKNTKKMCRGEEGDGVKGPKELHQQVMRGRSNLGRAPGFFLTFTIETTRSLVGAAHFLRAPCLS